MGRGREERRDEEGREERVRLRGGNYMLLFYSCRKIILKTVPVVPHQSEVGSSFSIPF